MSLAQDFGTSVGFCFNRKEAKTHGDGGSLVGAQLKAGQRVVLVEDVVTAGTTLNEIVPVLRDSIGVEVVAVVILVDRAEKGRGELSAVQEAQRELGLHIAPIVTIHEIISYLSAPNGSGFQFDAALRERIDVYRAEYGVGYVG
jgi:orotate phosphoribosyltransferase